MRKRYRENMTMDEIMRTWPETIRVILDHRLLCVGCPIAGFHTVDDAIREHEIDGDRFRVELLSVIAKADGRTGRKTGRPRSARPPAGSGDS